MTNTNTPVFFARCQTQLAFLLLFVFFASCATNRSIVRSADNNLYKDSVLKHALVGVSVFDPATQKTLFERNGATYFIPASNIKIVSCYTAMKYLGDSLPGIKYAVTDKGVLLVPTGDPSLLHTDFEKHPVLEFLQKEQRDLFITDAVWKSEAWGSGWSWDDYNEDYLVERSALPVYGNIIKWVQERQEPKGYDSTQPDVSTTIYSIPEVEWKVRFDPTDNAKNFYVQRNKEDNIFTITEGKEKKATQDVPYVTFGIKSGLELLKEAAGKEITIWNPGKPVAGALQTIYSQPTDSLLKPMMHRSDNFYAEQVLMMVSQQLLGYQNDGKLTDTLLRSTLNGLPHSPRWADGSGLSRYNLFTPQDFIYILDKMRQEFGMERIKGIFPAGGRGTLSRYFKGDSVYLYAKTGTLSGVVCLSGFLQARSGKWLVFSVLVNNHRGSATAIRRKVELFLNDIRNKY